MLVVCFLWEFKYSQEDSIITEGLLIKRKKIASNKVEETLIKLEEWKTWIQ